MKNLYIVILGLFISNIHYMFTNTDKPITIAILARDKAHCLPLYLSCIENQTWPKSKTYLYIKTNNNTDKTAEILSNWVEKVKDQYLGIYFDDSNIESKEYKNHEWDCARFKLLGKIRQDSLNYAYERNSDYFVADCDNFIFSTTIETLQKSGFSLIAPLLHTSYAYSNFHSKIDENGYYADSPFYFPLVNQEIKGLIQVPVIHCTYFIRHEIVNQMSYDDESYRYEYVVFSDNARKKNIPQYLDTRESYGKITFANNLQELEEEPWFKELQNLAHVKEDIKAD